MNVALLGDRINMCHLNVQSLCARQMSKFNELKSCFIDSKLDLICLSETWLNDSISDNMIEIDGYKLLRNHRNYSRGGALCIYYKSDLGCKFISASDLSVGIGDMDRTDCLFAEFRVDNHKILLGVVYSPPGCDCSNIIDRKLSELSLQYTNVI